MMQRKTKIKQGRTGKKKENNPISERVRGAREAVRFVCLLRDGVSSFLFYFSKVFNFSFLSVRAQRSFAVYLLLPTTWIVSIFPPPSFCSCFFLNCFFFFWHEVKLGKSWEKMQTRKLSRALYFAVVLLIVWTVFLLSTLRKQVSSQTSSNKGSEKDLLLNKEAYFLATLSPHLYGKKLLEAISASYPNLKPSADLADLQTLEKQLLVSGGALLTASTWKDPPEWLGYGYSPQRVSTEQRSKFQNEISELLRQAEGPQFYYSSFLPFTINDWLNVLPEDGKVFCLLGRRKTVQEEIFSAMDSMNRSRLSAKEARTILVDVFLTNYEAACLERKAIMVAFEYDQKSKNFVRSSHLTHSNEFDETSMELKTEYFSSLKNLEDNPIIDGWPKLFRRDDEAYLSIVTASKTSQDIGSDASYIEGAVGLGRSLTFFDATREKILLVTESELQSEENLLKATNLGGWTIKNVEPVKDLWFTKCMYRPTRVHQKVRWGLMASKLRAFELVEKKAIIYLDLDICVTGLINRLFNLVPKEYTCISEGGIQHQYLNAGFLFLRPSKAVFDNMMKYYAENKPKALFNNLIDCTEMGLLNAFFGKPDKLEQVDDSLVVQEPSDQIQVNGKTATLPLDSPELSVGRPDVSRDYSSVAPPLAIHFIRKDLCPKPWSVGCSNGKPTRDVKGGCDTFPYIVWCRFRSVQSSL